MRLGIFLALVASAAALHCNSGNLILEEGVITGKSLESKVCLGTCTRTVIEAVHSTVVFFGCQENEITNFLNEKEGKVGCSATELGSECVCKDADFCSDFKAEENIKSSELANTGELDGANGPKCYVGYYAVSLTDTQTVLNAGDTVYCSANMACASLKSAIYGYNVEAYFCTPAAVCDSLIGSRDDCGQVKNEQNTVNGCCCSKLDDSCLKLVNPAVKPPTVVTNDTQTVNCYSGAYLNYQQLNGGAVTQCRGSCSSFSLRTSIGQGPAQTNYVLDLYTCDPVELCTSLGLSNSCGNLAISGSNSIIRGCCCNNDNCIDPTVTPPKYPVKQLKCFTGFYIPSNNYSVGAEQYCDGQCGRMEFVVGTNLVKYMMCAPYATCQGLGIAQADQCYNPPLEEETKLCCCSTFDNCNIDKIDRPNIPVNVNNVPTNNYPILCYGGIYLNGNPVSKGAYSMCYGECATASFSTTIYGQSHNTTIYTCDPVSMCKSASITNSCGVIDGLPGVTACCCDQDVCYDPNRQPYGKLTCYAGISIPADNYLTGGEMLCDGWCASLSTLINNKTTNTYWCAPVQTCRRYALGMGGDNNCGSISGSDNTLTGCCCSEKDNCNIPDSLLVNVTSIPARIEPPIVCYEGLWINGQPSTPGRYRVCDGECASIFLGTTTKNNTIFTSTLYTCEPSGSCSSMKLNNNCSMIDQQVNACCCDTDACLDPTVNRVPGKQLTCYVGVQTNWNNTISVGAEVNCNGYCANMTSVANGYLFTSYHCMPKAVCNGLGLSNQCGSILLDRAISGCCCDSASNCNAAPSLNTTMPISPPLSPIACYSGMQVNGVFTTGSGFQTCMGDCMSLNIQTTYANQSLSATIYSCDPTSVCTGLNIVNRCHDIEKNVIRGCCCSDSGCIDPTVNPEKKPNGPGITCLVGVLSPYSNVSVVAESTCYGSCASITTTVGQANVTAFACVQNAMCNAMNVYDSCGPLPVDKGITGCCCNNANNCNANGFNVQTNATAPHYHEYPVICYSGLYINGAPVGGGQWEACKGDCVSITLNSTYHSKFYSADFYTCDPSTVCHQLNVVNRCTTLEDQLGACCCDTDTCLDPTHRYPPKRPGNPLKCYVGLKTANVSVGSEVYCNGQCASIYGMVGNNKQSKVTSYMCAPTSVCKSLELVETPKQLPLDASLMGTCCDTYNNCNVKDSSIDTSANVSQVLEYPITCYIGIQVNGIWVNKAGFQSCNGECAMLTLNSTSNGTAFTASIYTCDPSAVCYNLGIVNNCLNIQDGVQGCCCRTNGCIDPTKPVPKLPGKPLTCYVGMQAANISVGAAVVCNGKCSSLSGIVAGQQVTTYHCIDSSICRSLELDDTCNTLYADREVNACCCDNYDYCNILDPTLPIPTPSPNTEFPITCWSGVYLDGNAITPTKWTACSGDCVSVTINTTLGGNHTATLYTCDPSTVCTSLNTINTCTTVESGVQACCCNSDACIDPNNGRNPGNPLMCYVGVKTGKVNAGASVPCNGKCSSLSGKINGTLVETFHCSDSSICRSLQLYDECLPLPGDAEVVGCCCNNRSYCNLDIDPAITPPAPSNYSEPPIACYSGLVINGKSILPAKYVTCQGECASIEIDTKIGNTTHTAALYTCDPSTVCQSLNVSNTCASLDLGVKGCCCNTDVCIDPTRNKSPDVPLTCYVGVYAAYNNFSVGADVTCAGKCASLETVFNKNKVKSYHCVASSVCSTLALDNSCNSVQLDNQVTACCCDNGNNCNAVNEPVSSNFNGTTPGNMIACWSGLYLNGAPLAKPTYTGCTGECAVIQFNTTVYANTTNSLTLYTCDPVSVCNSLSLKNACNSIDSLPGLTGCCCDSDACVDGSSIYPKTKKHASMLNAFSAVFLALVYMMLRC